MKTRSWACCVWLATALAACTGDNEDGEFIIPDASTGANTDSAADPDTTADGASSADDGGATDGPSNDGGDSSLADGGPDGDGSTVDGDADTDVTTFRLTNQMGTNLLSSSDVHPICTLSADPTPGNYRVNCEERNGSVGPCRTLEFVLGGDPVRAPQSGSVFVAVVKTTPAANEAVVQYYESVDCTTVSTNGWVQILPGGDVTVTLSGDNGMSFVLHDVMMGPRPVGSENHNALGTFTAAGRGEATGFFR